jgi:hypothetical protein
MFTAEFFIAVIALIAWVGGTTFLSIKALEKDKQKKKH